MTEEEYFAQRNKTVTMYLPYKFSDPLFECPICKKITVCRDDSIILTSYPPQHNYRCLKQYGGCGGYTVAR